MSAWCLMQGEGQGIGAGRGTLASKGRCQWTWRSFAKAELASTACSSVRMVKPLERSRRSAFLPVARRMEDSMKQCQGCGCAARSICSKLFFGRGLGTACGSILPHRLGARSLARLGAA